VTEAGGWWLKTKWLEHRNAIADVSPMLDRLQEARGAAFMTSGRVLEVLDAKDPAALVESWLLGAPLSRGLGLPARLCAWCEGDETCDQPVRAANATFCEAHARSARKEKTRARVTHFRAHAAVGKDRGDT